LVETTTMVTDLKSEDLHQERDSMISQKTTQAFNKRVSKEEVTLWDKTWTWPEADHNQREDQNSTTIATNSTILISKLALSLQLTTTMVAPGVVFFQITLQEMKDLCLNSNHSEMRSTQAHSKE
jgi:hypothetical protein